MTKGKLAQRALSIWLGGFSAQDCMEHIELIRRIWMKEDGKNPDFEHCAPLAIISAVLLEKTTGIRVLTEDTAVRWIEDCEEMIEMERTGKKRASA